MVEDIVYDLLRLPESEALAARHELQQVSPEISQAVKARLQQLRAFSQVRSSHDQTLGGLQRPDHDPQ